MSIARTASLIVSSVLMAIAIGWSIAAVASPGWQVVDLREYQSVHYHGLWQDCARTAKTGIYEGDPYKTEGALHCTYKFDFDPGQLVSADARFVDQNSPAGENEYHTWHVYQVIELILVGLAVIGGIGAIIVSVGACRYTSCAIIFSVMSFVCLVLSFGVVSSFFIIAHRVDYRFVQGIVGTNEASLGAAYYFELVSCIFFLLAFICSLLSAYLSMQSGDVDSQRRVIQRGAPLLVTTPYYVKDDLDTHGNNHSPSNNFHGYQSSV